MMLKQYEEGMVYKFFLTKIYFLYKKYSIGVSWDWNLFVLSKFSCDFPKRK